MSAPKPPPVLYQYTRWTGVEGMIKSGVVWATHFESLNDREEVWYAKSMLIHLAKALDEIPVERTRTGVPLAQCAVRALELPPGLKYACVASFSEEPDSLNQWVSYADHGAGFCVGVASKQFEAVVKFANQERQHGVTWSLRRVVYEPCDQTTALLDVLAKATVCDVPTSGHDDCGRCDAIAEGFGSVALTLKDPHWHAEREWRLIGCSATANGMLLRASGTAHVAYREFLTASRDRSIKRPRALEFHSVSIGPKLFRDRASWFAAIEALRVRRRVGFAREFRATASRATLK